MAIENIVKTIRKEHNETQRALADAIGVDTKTIKNLESTGTCSLEVALRISHYYKMSVNNIFRATDISGTSRTIIFPQTP